MDYTSLVLEYNRQIKTALLTMYEALPPGQQKQVLKNESVAALFSRYKIDATNAKSAQGE